MIIDCIADLHGHYPKLQGGDLLIIAGDWTASDNPGEVIKFGLWVNEQQYKRKIVIAGNHDNMIQTTPMIFEGLPDFVLTYLCDSGTEFEYYDPNFPKEDEGFLPSGKRTLKIYGSPWTKTFPGMNPKCKAFTVDTEEELFEKWALIPHDVDILITHSPPHEILDELMEEGKHAGSVGLRGLLTYAFRPKLWVYGHIHEGYGQETFRDSTICVNASHVNERYEPVNKPIRIEL